jgi:hypothetical protein
MKIQRDTIHAIAQAGRLWAIWKDMAKMSATTAAMDRRARHAEGIVFARSNRAIECSPETGPARTAFELRY